jgi:hypothetical protein
MAYKVKALADGYYGDQRRTEGKVFFIKKAKEFSSVWMKSLDSALDTALQSDPKLWERHKHNLLKSNGKKVVKLLPTVKAPPPHEDEEPSNPDDDVEQEAELDDTELSEGHDSDAVI